jgi:hypothetical protein
MDCRERVLVARLFASGVLPPSDWDALFAHLRTGCDSCSAFYSERRAASGADPAEAISPIESAAIVRTLRSRAEAKASRPVLWRRPAVWAAVGATCVALLMIGPRMFPGEGDGETQMRGDEGERTGIDLRCAANREGATAVDVKAGCPKGGNLLVQALASASVGAKTVSIALVDTDLRLLDLRRSDAHPDVTDLLTASLPANEHDVRVFVLWSARSLERPAVEAALRVAQNGRVTLQDLVALPVDGVFAQRSQLVSVRADGAN